MGKRRIPPEEKRAAMLRIRSGASSYRDEAKRTGLDPSTLHDGVKRMKAREEAVAPPSVPSAGAPPIDRALEAAGIAAKKDDTRPATPEELKLAAPQALQIDADFCVSWGGQIKTLAVVGVGVVLKKIPPLEERLFKLGQLGPALQQELRANAPQLAPIIRKYFPEGPGLIALVLVAAMEAAGTYGALNAMGEEYAAKREAEREKAEEEAPQRRNGSTSATSSPAAPEPWMTKITDKPR